MSSINHLQSKYVTGRDDKVQNHVSLISVSHLYFFKSKRLDKVQFIFEYYATTLDHKYLLKQDL